MGCDNVRVHTALHGKPALKQAVQVWGNKIWDRRWRSLKTCSQTKSWFPFLREDRSPLICRLSRTDFGLMIHFITGHNYLRRHRKVMGLGEDTSCRLCGEGIEDSLHLWENCKATIDLRGGTFIMYAHYLVPKTAQHVPSGTTYCWANGPEWGKYPGVQQHWCVMDSYVVQAGPVHQLLASGATIRS